MTYTYYWYTRIVEQKYNPDYINKIILEHNWEEFSQIKSEYRNSQHESFPEVVYDVINDENVPLTKDTFMQIDDVECENG